MSWQLIEEWLKSGQRKLLHLKWALILGATLFLIMTIEMWGISLAASILSIGMTGLCLMGALKCWHWKQQLRHRGKIIKTIKIAYQNIRREATVDVETTEDHKEPQ